MSASLMTKQNYSLTPKVMVVDDDECIRKAMYALLSFEGFDVATAVGGDDCLRQLREGFRGVILMDIMMPERNGWDTIREIEKAGLLQGNIIAILTAMGEPDEQMEGLQEVVIDYITKPFDAKELVDVVRRHLGLLEQIHVGS